MAEIVNLRRVRKARARAEAEAIAAANRDKHGRPPAEREAGKAERLRSERTLDAHRREDGEG